MRRGIKGFYLKAGRGAWGLVGDIGGQARLEDTILGPALVLGNTFSDSVPVWLDV